MEVVMVGADSSFRDFYQARIAALSRVAYLLTGDAHLAEDLLQQALIRVASRWESVLASGDPEPYVRKVLYHQHISWWRRSRREWASTGGLPETVQADHASAVVVTLSLQQALARLAPRQRAVLVLRFYEDLSDEQVAAALGCSVNTMTMQLSFRVRACRNQPACGARPRSGAGSETETRSAASQWAPLLRSTHRPRSYIDSAHHIHQRAKLARSDK
jgi:RNA polymerase sigma-70 factor (sigma-E family)